VERPTPDTMTDPALNERITRSLAFMLRHRPERFDLEVDAHGFADVEEVLCALNERLGEPVEEADLVDAVESGDRQRYEIVQGKIRALYGHSIPVEPGPDSKPPEFLYVAIPARDVDRAQRFGLRGGRRSYLHLALTPEDAR
jgi:putative RNA 2'-phosphotransferase